ncbi:MAG TPA: hypothetical protein PLX48_01705 [Candidatus Paceibacterota bacterium]|nr:hypothetical protein [Candidatus Paceibacterota bacterium]
MFKKSQKGTGALLDTRPPEEKQKDFLWKEIVANAEPVNWQEKINISDLKVGDYVVVIGDDNSEGQIEAKLIRVVPQPPTDQRLGGPRL